MTRWKAIQVVTLLLAVAAALISFNLLAKHLTGSSGAAWFESGCSDREEPGAANCAAVLSSRYGSWPPRLDDEPPGRNHIPVAFLGWIYYTTLCIWLVGIGRPDRSRRWIHLIPLGLLTAGLLSSAFYTYIMFTQLNEWCPWCLVTHILNVCLAVGFLGMWPRRPKAIVRKGPAARHREADTAAPPGRARTHPSGRLVLTTLLAIFAAVFGQSQLMGRTTAIKHATTAKAEFDRCVAAVKRIQGDAKALVENWRRAEHRTIPVLPDEPYRPGIQPETSPTTVVVFSDFACPPCGRFATFFEERVEPLFDGRLPVVYRYYPLNTACNRRVSRTLYEQGCLAVTMAEAARDLGGAELFWRAHDYLYAQQQAVKHGELRPADLAAALGVEAQALETAMDPVAASQRIAQHVAHAATCEISGTPSVFVNGRHVDTLALTEIGFWDQLADEFWDKLGQSRPASTRLSENATAD